MALNAASNHTPMPSLLAMAFERILREQQEAIQDSDAARELGYVDPITYMWIEESAVMMPASAAMSATRSLPAPIDRLTALQRLASTKMPNGHARDFNNSTGPMVILTAEAIVYSSTPATPIQQNAEFQKKRAALKRWCLQRQLWLQRQLLRQRKKMLAELQTKFAAQPEAKAEIKRIVNEWANKIEARIAELKHELGETPAESAPMQEQPYAVSFADKAEYDTAMQTVMNLFYLFCVVIYRESASAINAGDNDITITGANSLIRAIREDGEEKFYTKLLTAVAVFGTLQGLDQASLSLLRQFVHGLRFEIANNTTLRMVSGGFYYHRPPTIERVKDMVIQLSISGEQHPGYQKYLRTRRSEEPQVHIGTMPSADVARNRDSVFGSSMTSVTYGMQVPSTRPATHGFPNLIPADSSDLLGGSRQPGADIQLCDLPFVTTGSQKDGVSVKVPTDGFYLPAKDPATGETRYVSLTEYLRDLATYHPELRTPGVCRATNFSAATDSGDGALLSMSTTLMPKGLSYQTVPVAFNGGIDDSGPFSGLGQQIDRGVLYLLVTKDGVTLYDGPTKKSIKLFFADDGDARMLEVRAREDMIDARMAEGASFEEAVAEAHGRDKVLLIQIPTLAQPLPDPWARLGVASSFDAIKRSNLMMGTTAGGFGDYVDRAAVTPGIFIGARNQTFRRGIMRDPSLPVRITVIDHAMVPTPFFGPENAEQLAGVLHDIAAEHHEFYSCTAGQVGRMPYEFATSPAEQAKHRAIRAILDDDAARLFEILASGNINKDTNVDPLIAFVARKDEARIAEHRAAQESGNSASMQMTLRELAEYCQATQCLFLLKPVKIDSNILHKKGYFPYESEIVDPFSATSGSCGAPGGIFEPPSIQSYPTPPENKGGMSAAAIAALIEMSNYSNRGEVQPTAPRSTSTALTVYRAPRRPFRTP